MSNTSIYTETRQDGLGYVKHGRNTWRLVDTVTGATIGPVYATKAELLADLDRFASIRFN